MSFVGGGNQVGKPISVSICSASNRKPEATGTCCRAIGKNLHVSSGFFQCQRQIQLRARVRPTAIARSSAFIIESIELCSVAG